jgi:hypothetical protein
MRRQQRYLRQQRTTPEEWEAYFERKHFEFREGLAMSNSRILNAEAQTMWATIVTPESTARDATEEM